MLASERYAANWAGFHPAIAKAHDAHQQRASTSGHCTAVLAGQVDPPSPSPSSLSEEASDSPAPGLLFESCSMDSEADAYLHGDTPELPVPRHASTFTSIYTGPESAHMCISSACTQAAITGCYSS